MRSIAPVRVRCAARYTAALALSVLPQLVACRDDRAGTPVVRESAQSSARIALVDSVAYEREDASGTLHRIEIRARGRVDTVPDVLTESLPRLVGDTTVLGFRYSSEGEILGGFRYDVRLRRADTLPIPAEVRSGLTAASISPDGVHLAYAALADGRALGVVRVWPNGAIVARTPDVAVPPTDVTIGDAAWTSATEPIIYIDPFSDGSGRWVRFRGALPGGQWKEDTIRARARDPVPERARRVP